MPDFHDYPEKKDWWIYFAINDNKFKFDPESQLYKYSNSKYPNKKYSKIFDPKSFMKRGDVIHFGMDNYRNNNKMIFDGKKLKHLYAEIDDYGSVPPEFVCGDELDEFNIGDFEQVIDHNSINWLSKEKLKQIEIYENKLNIYGKVTIKNKEWIIIFDMGNYTCSEFQPGWWGCKTFKCNIEDNGFIKIHNKNSYIITAKNEENINKLKELIVENNDVKIINSYHIGWFLYHIRKDFKLDNDYKPTFPLIWKKITQSYTSESLIVDNQEYDFYLNQDKKCTDKIYINEIIGYTISIELIEKNIIEKMKIVKEIINRKIEKYDFINERIPFSRISDEFLEVYL